MKNKNFLLERTLLSSVGKAIADFSMIKNNDKIMVCLSGGKDSWTMLDILLKLQKKAPVRFDLFAINIDPKFEGYKNNLIADYCRKEKIPFQIIKTSIKDIITEKKRKNSSYCAFCARLRRGTIYTAAKKFKATKIALGHHREDLLETLLLNLFYTGQLKSMAPIMKTDDKKHIVIRPLIYTSEAHIREYAQDKFPIISANCPLSNCNNRQRARIKKLITELEKEIPNLKNTMLKALSQVIKTHLLDKTLQDYQNI